ncbi:MAG: hypothetical protein C0621_09675 [Desulfuromonas sp.]|nr:MAG: hypothetical protein C0621_09675 [Desulfuromonas sp.]
MRRLITMFVFLLLLLGFFGCRSEPFPSYPPRTMPPEAKSAVAVGEGRALFMRLCAGCHGRADEGRSPRADFFAPQAPDFRDPRYARHDPAYLYWRIDLGKQAEPYRSHGSVMPGWHELGETAIWNLVAYLRQRAGGKGDVRR